MSSRWRVVPAWMPQVAAVLGGERVTRSRVLALLALGMVGAGMVRVNQVAAMLPLPVRVRSTARRLRRFPANPAVQVATLGTPLLPVLLARGAGQAVELVFAPTPYRADGTVLGVGSAVHRRVLPLRGPIVPQHEPWPEQLATRLPAWLAPIAAALPSGCHVTLLGDRGVCGPTFIAAAQARGGDGLLRLNGGAPQAHRRRGRDATGPGPEVRLGDGVAPVGSGWCGPVQICKAAGWREGWLTVPRRPGRRAWGMLFRTRPGGPPRRREDRRRARGEATFADGQRRGWGLEHSRMTDPVPRDRLLLVWHLALGWRQAWGRLVITRGLRRHCDRPDRRARSLLHLGWLWRHHLLRHDRCPPLLFRYSATGWSARGTP